MGILSLFSLIIGWLLDLVFGDPPRLPHPVVAFGRWIAFCEHHLNRGRHRMAKGAAVALLSIGGVFAVAWAANVLLMHPALHPAAYVGVNAVIVFFCLAGHTLRREVADVFRAVDCSLDDGRRQVARIVGRDTATLTAQEVRTAALETLAENLSDGIVAPLFWFALLGSPGMLAYKMVNTLDSMIGYRTERYRAFGCWAARIDDIANYVPARATALLILLAHALCHTPRGFTRQLRFVARYGPAHASPNSGWPEAALAAVLDCRFGGTHDYFGQAVEKPYIGTNDRPLTTTDMLLSIRLAIVAETITVAIIAASLWLHG